MCAERMLLDVSGVAYGWYCTLACSNAGPRTDDPVFTARAACSLRSQAPFECCDVIPLRGDALCCGLLTPYFPPGRAPRFDTERDVLIASARWPARSPSD